MAILKIARMGHPVLLTQAAPVADPTAPDIARLVADMFETMDDASGTGLAAPQVHVPLRLFVFRVSAARITGAPDDPPQGNTVLINPEIVPLGEEKVSWWEGCLSVPGMRGAVPRWRRVRYRGVGLDGKEIVAEVSGFHADVVQHENDHLDGLLYPMRMTDLRLFGFNEELSRAVAAPGKGGA